MPVSSSLYAVLSLPKQCPSETERLRAELATIKMKGTKLEALMSGRERQVQSQLVLDDNHEVRNVLPLLFLGTESSLVQCKFNFIFFPGSKHALKKLFEKVA